MPPILARSREPSAIAERQRFDDCFLVLAPTGRDALLTCELLAKAGLASRNCRDIEELCDRVRDEGAAGLMIAEEVLAPAALHCLTEALVGQDPWSDIPILIFTGEAAGTRTRPPIAHMLALLGNVTLLDRPLRPITMVSAARTALRVRRRQYTARAALQDQRREVRERDQFLAMLGHELRNPLGAILMAVELLEQEQTDAARCRGILRRQANHLARLVDDLLDVARVTSGKIVLQRVPIDASALIRRCVLSMDSQIQAQRLRVELALPSQPARVLGDPVRLEQIVVNLMTNAVKYTPAGGRIEIAIALESGRAVLRFRDTGVGIAADMLSRIFDLFAQVEETLERAKGGLGIGLTMVKRLVELHGGSVDAASPGVGQGSLFTVRLPLLEPETATAPAEAPHPSAPPAVAHDILIVEDNADSRDLLRSILQACGHRVEAVADGASAVDRAVRSRPDVLVVDIGLPGLDGYGVARKVREALGQDVFLIAMTGYGQPEDRRRALEAGFDIHFTKPVDLDAIRTLLSQRALVGAPG
jgi:signal transduction histidine kinase/CheY-like chemotaxis protein